MSGTTSHKGPPPSIGWWPVTCMSGALRWWDGEQWSVACFKDSRPETIEVCSITRAGKPQDEIEWCERPADWPERSLT